MRRVSSALLPALILALAPASAHAFTLRDAPGGKHARWHESSVTIVADPSVTRIHPRASSAVAAAFAAWDGEPGTSPPTITVVDATADELGYRAGGENHNTVQYFDGGISIAGGALAITIVTFDSEGKILDADVVVNGGLDRPWTVIDKPAVAGQAFGGDDGAYDLQNVVTHEAGHLLGFGEEQDDTDATMYVSSGRGETKKRALHASDIQGLHELYDGAADDASTASCAVGAAPRRSPGGFVGFALVAGAVGLAVGAASRRRGGARRGLVAGVSCAALVAGITPAGSSRAASAAHLFERADVVATVTAATPRWEGGLLVTRLSLRPTACHVADCPTNDVALEVYGGTVDGLTQVVGHGIVPRVGALVPLAVHGGKLAIPRGVLAPRGPVETAPVDAPVDEKRVGGPAVPPTPAKADPRRLHERAEADLAVVIDVRGESSAGVVENLSEGGLFVATDGVAQPGELVAVEFALPGEDASIRARAEVRWTRGVATDGTSGGMGLRFVELGASEATAIGRFVANRAP